MTTIVGLNIDDKIIIAGDNRGSNCLTYLQDKKPKVFKVDNFIFGVCGSYRVIQILRYKFKAPKRYIEQSTDDYIFNTFVDEIFDLLNRNNALEIKDNLKRFEGSFLFGYENELYQMQSNFQIIINNKNFDAVGSGSYHAQASLYSTQNINIKPKERLKRAIECANEFVIYVDDKFDYVELEKDKKK